MTKCRSKYTRNRFTLNDAIIAINQLRKFMTQTDCSENNFKFLNDLEKEIYNKRCNVLKQSKITDFMTKGNCN